MAKPVQDANSSARILGVVIILLGYPKNALGRRESGVYEFLQLNSQWPKSYCNTASADCKNVPDIFTISRFSPMYYPNTIVPPFNDSGCELGDEPVELHVSKSYSVEIVNKSYNASIVLLTQEDDFSEDGELRDEMETYWPSMEGIDFELWKDDWNTYGKCFNTPESPRSYFEAGLRLVDYADVLKRLDRRDIKPSGDDNKYSLRAIRYALEKSLGAKKVNIICNEDANGTIQLFQVGMCFNRAEGIQGCRPIDLNPSICDLAPNEMIVFP